MPVELYETLYMLDANKMASDGDSIRTSLHASLEKYNAEIVVSRSWDEGRKIAYPIRKQNITHKKAFYHIIYYKMESTKHIELNTDMRLSMTDYLIRYMTSHVDPKWAEAILDVANKDQNPGFALHGMQEESTPTEINPGYEMDGMPIDGMDGPPRDRGDRDRPAGDRPAGGAGRRPRRESSDKPE